MEGLIYNEGYVEKLDLVKRFILLVTKLTKDKIAYIEYLSNCLGEISKGDLSYKIDVMGEDELAQVTRNITKMEYELQNHIKGQLKAEKTKNELVTNVAHDFRTPLTSIIDYIGLVRNKTYTTSEEHDKYLEIAYDKSEKRKVIIKDLFELTKLHQGSVELNKEVISVSNLLNQSIEELVPLVNDKNIGIETYIEKIEANKFFERFYRADKSWNSQVTGSGLGLAIARNIVELHGGRISAKINRDLISLKVALQKAIVDKNKW